MLRFRTTADENLYLALRTELYVAAAQLGDPQMTSLIMRNFGKLEALVHMEGVRQGLACAVLSEGMPGLAEQRPSAVLAHVYGDAATPLVRVENLRWEGKGEKPAWLDATESTFPAMTYAEAMGIEQPKPPMYRVDAPHAPTPVPTRTPKPSDDELSRLFDENDEPPTPASPEQLAHYRDAMVAMKSDGVAIGSWSELMLTLALRLGEDLPSLGRRGDERHDPAAVRHRQHHPVRRRRDAPPVVLEWDPAHLLPRRGLPHLARPLIAGEARRVGDEIIAPVAGEDPAFHESHLRHEPGVERPEKAWGNVHL